VRQVAVLLGFCFFGVGGTGFGVLCCEVGGFGYVGYGFLFSCRGVLVSLFGGSCVGLVVFLLLASLSVRLVVSLNMISVA